ncbi:alpha/beta fold hydrolase [Vallicoccus soli]|uniref:Alpha/beta fold hydrolase n=1 Tax=Vallicoccus soli TaxID=2339232 RepID=A0A3A3YZ11_9ACTN|nr:alpha/beta fold hydrolase [Vallicoccus soli]RJK95299.1 alpha/beta fold hydrolase [Vallicoccus soli]
MHTYARDGLLLPVRDEGPRDGEAVVLLHGWPQTGAAYDAVVPALHAAGLRTLVPDQRGYAATARPRGRRAYRLGEVVADALALLDAAEVERAHVVGHDWGGAVAWLLAGAHPDRLLSATVLSTPHPGALRTAALVGDQALRSSYMGLLQLPALPEALLLARGGAPLHRLLRASGLPERHAREYVARMREPGALSAALGWYRALPLAGGLGAGPARVPTTYLWGSRDAALGRTAAERTGEHVAADYRFEVLEGAGHWLPETRAGTVAAAVLARVAG